MWTHGDNPPTDEFDPFIGPQQVLEGVLARIPEAWEGFEIQVDRLVTDGDTVVVQGRYHATRARATGRPLDAQVVHVWDLRDGKVVRFQQYVDTRQLAAALGETTA